MPLNPQVEALLAMMAEAPKPDYANASIEEIRAVSDLPMMQGPPPAVARAEDLSIALEGRTLDARLYVPEGCGDKPPLTLYYHGGGWVLGTLDTHDGTCRALARASRSAVLSVAYRLAPEHPFPAPLEDCYDALCWAHDNAERLGADPARLAVAGDSAGANLAAATAILARDRGGPALRHQLLIYPVADNTFSQPSYAENGGGDYFLSTEMMAWFWALYLGDQSEGSDIALARILAAGDLSNLPPATVITAEYDPLRDEGMTYAQGLADAGVPVDSEIAPGMIHGFFSMFEAVPDAMQWIERAGVALSGALE
ncbi:MAG: chloramphenicol hydrolase [Sphingomonadaceae bacterium]|jgi:acetyl esterase